MIYKTKIYHDGSHYVALPHTIKKHTKKPKITEELVEIKDDIENDNEQLSACKTRQKSPYSPIIDENEAANCMKLMNGNNKKLPLLDLLNKEENCEDKSKEICHYKANFQNTL